MILVTGGTGYIGCVAVRQLLDEGEAVRVYDKRFELQDVLVPRERQARSSSGSNRSST